MSKKGNNEASVSDNVNYPLYECTNTDLFKYGVVTSAVIVTLTLSTLLPL